MIKIESNGVNMSIIPTILLLFLILDSLNIEIKKLSLRSISGQNYNMIHDSKVITIGIFLNPENYFTPRSIIY
jgi:hypothetical protein